MDKIKAFFASTATKVVCWVILALDIVALIIGGTTTEAINSAVVLTGAIVAAVAALIAFIAGQAKKK